MATGIEEALVHYIKSIGAIAPLIDGRVFLDFVPSGENRPCVTYRVEDLEESWTMSGPEGLAHCLFRIKVWSLTPVALRVVVRPLVRALNGFRGPWGVDPAFCIKMARVSNLHDVYEQHVHSEEVGTFGMVFDLLVVYNVPEE